MVLVIDPQIAGIAGDMLLCSLVDIGADVEKIKKCASMGAQIAGTSIRKLEFSKVQKCGISATKLILETDKQHNLHTGKNVADCIAATCKKSNLSDAACKFADESVQALIHAESNVHAEPSESVHFHEMASFDTVLDIVGTASALDSLGLYDENIVAMPVSVGGGSITFSHGRVSNPGPAILEIFKDSCIKITGTASETEMTTPTGACMLRTIASECLQFYPAMEINKIGYGAGNNDFKDFANVLKVVQGAGTLIRGEDNVAVLETSIDDVSGEVLGYTMEKLMSMGARDVMSAPVTGKKGRPANTLTVICDADSASTLAGILMSETGTLGVRMRMEKRMIAKRSTDSIGLTIRGREFQIRFKTNESQGTFKIEADDIQAVSEHTGEPFGSTERMLREMMGGKNAKL